MFIDRKDAALQLGGALSKYRDKHVMVLGIPRGGVETGYYVARYLNADFAAVIARKLAYPSNPETAFGAIAEDGSVYLLEGARRRLTEKEIAAIVEEQKQEIQRRIQVYRHGRPLPDLVDRVVIIVDDGIATGATIFATVKLCENKRPRKIIVAAPISGVAETIKLRQMVDDVVILDIPGHYGAVSQGYQNFSNLTDDATIAFIEEWDKEHVQHD